MWLLFPDVVFWARSVDISKPCYPMKLNEVTTSFLHRWKKHQEQKGRLFGIRNQLTVRFLSSFYDYITLLLLPQVGKGGRKIMPEMQKGWATKNEMNDLENHNIWLFTGWPLPSICRANARNDEMQMCWKDNWPTTYVVPRQQTWAEKHTHKKGKIAF